MTEDKLEKNYCKLIEEREQIVEYGTKMLADKLTTGTGGNISIFNRKEKRL